MTGPVHNIVSLSGGKDSTAMLHMMLERGESIHSIVFLDTGWEFPEMYNHLTQVEEKTRCRITRLKPRRTFNYYLLDHPVCHRGESVPYRIGYGWPSPFRRWCTREKINAICKYQRGIPSVVDCVGIAADETERLSRPSRRRMKWKRFRYPLVEYGMSGADNLTYCHSLGYDWGGLYDIFQRVSCFCCPLQPLNDLRNLRIHFPQQWRWMRETGARIPHEGARFNHEATLEDLDARFTAEMTAAAQNTGAESLPHLTAGACD